MLYLSFMQCSTLLHNARLHSTVQVHQRREHPALLQGTIRKAQGHADCWHATPGRDSLGHTPSTSDNHLQQEPQFAASQQCPPWDRAGSATANSAAAHNRYGQQVRKRTLLLTAPAIAPLAAVLLHTCTPPDNTPHDMHQHTRDAHETTTPKLHGFWWHTLTRLLYPANTPQQLVPSQTSNQPVRQPRQPLGEGTHKVASALPRDHHKTQCPAATRCTRPGTWHRSTPLTAVKCPV